MDSLNTANTISRMVVDLLAKHGVKKIVLSPGSRNTPLIIAANRSRDIECFSVVDERSAAFIALGLGSISCEPVALICTSGTAVLNYAPAVAEAYYRRVPLIVISADRPAEWIDQDDSQTLRQFEALSNFVKRSYNIPVGENDTNLWYADRLLNDAMMEATELGNQAPVHINVQLSEPLGTLAPVSSDNFRSVRVVNPRTDLTVQKARELGRIIASPTKVMIIAGFHKPDKRLNSALAKISMLPNVVVLTESIANLHGENFVQRIDTTLSEMTDEERQSMVPDCVITLGGALVSRHIKQYLRSNKPTMHCHVAQTDVTVDCFQALTLRINMEAGIFFQQLASALQPYKGECDYAHKWQILKQRAMSTHQAYLSHAPWSDLKAMEIVSQLTPRGWNVQYSNGTAIRYGQLFATGKQHRCDCNRGVSGIDGSTSTAIGASLAYKTMPTLLITGDMSAQYDVGALGCGIIPANFKIIVLNNGGGGIFRFINSTKNLDELEERICMAQKKSPWEHLCHAYGLEYFHARNESQLMDSFRHFASDKSEQPCLLEIETPPQESAVILANYFKRKETFKNYRHDKLDSNQTV